MTSAGSQYLKLLPSAVRLGGAVPSALRIRRDFVKACSKTSPSASKVFWAGGGMAMFPASERTERSLCIGMEAVSGVFARVRSSSLVGSLSNNFGRLFVTPYTQEDRMAQAIIASPFGEFHLAIDNWF